MNVCFHCETVPVVRFISLLHEGNFIKDHFVKKDTIYQVIYNMNSSLECKHLYLLKSKWLKSILFAIICQIYAIAFFYNSSALANIAENGCMQKIPDIL